MDVPVVKEINYNTLAARAVGKTVKGQEALIMIEHNGTAHIFPLDEPGQVEGEGKKQLIQMLSGGIVAATAADMPRGPLQ